MTLPSVEAVVLVERLTPYTDARGLILEPVSPETMLRQRNVHAVITQPGMIRGNHYHTQGTETDILIGPALMRVREGGRLRDIAVPAGEVWRFTIPPGIAHAVKNTGPAPMTMVAFNTSPHDPQKPDVVRDVVLE